MRWLGLFTTKTSRKHRKLILPHRDFIICIVSLAIFHPHFSIRILVSAFFHPHFIIGIFLSAIRHPPSAIRHPPSAIRHPPSAIRRHPVFTLQRPENKTYINTLNDGFGRPKTMNYPASSSLHVEHSNLAAN